MVNTSANLTLFQGEYRNIQITVGDNVDLTNVELIKWSMALTENDDAVLTKSYPDSGIVLVNAAAGVFAIVLSGVDTYSLTPRVYYHQANYILANHELVAIAGTIRIRPTII